MDVDTDTRGAADGMNDRERIEKRIICDAAQKSRRTDGPCVDVLRGWRPWRVDTTTPRTLQRNVSTVGSSGVLATLNFVEL